MAEDVLVRKEGEITIVSLNRAHARNAVDGPTAHALARAFEARVTARWVPAACCLVSR
jgi:enoyl-CoA hydratase